ncbi:MAG: hypothetical protein EBZ60_06730 [Betaproteobacteria bacterium]|nr:hypothetical protein [Betaproteobacteria bacterium]
MLDLPLQLAAALDDSVIFSPGDIKFTGNTDMPKFGKKQDLFPSTEKRCRYAIVPGATHMSADRILSTRLRISMRATEATIWLFSEFTAPRHSLADCPAVMLSEELEHPAFELDPFNVHLSVPVTFYITSGTASSGSTMAVGATPQDALDQDITINGVPADVFLQNESTAVDHILCTDAVGQECDIHRGTQIVLHKPTLVDDDVIHRMPGIVIALTRDTAKGILLAHVWTVSGSLLSVALDADPLPPFVVTTHVPWHFAEFAVSYGTPGFSFVKTFDGHG